MPEYIARIRAATDLPLTVGFGISRPDHVAATAQIADGVVVASALINHLDTLQLADQPEGARAFVRQLADATRRAPGKGNGAKGLSATAEGAKQQ
jgi:tryptophan synthase alpha chain